MRRTTVRTAVKGRGGRGACGGRRALNGSGRGVGNRKRQPKVR